MTIPSTNFKSSVAALSDGIHSTSILFYEARDELCYVGCFQPVVLQDRFSKLGNHLKVEWEQCKELLLDCHSFGSDASVLDLLDADLVEIPKDSTRLLSRLTVLSSDLMKKSKEVAQKSKNTSKGYNAKAEEIKGVLRRAATRPSGFDPHIQRPSNERALNRLESLGESIHQIHLILSDVHRFWKTTSDLCRSISAAPSRDSLRAADALARSWEGTQEALLRSMEGIRAAHDVIAATGTTAEGATAPMCETKDTPSIRHVQAHTSSTFLHPTPPSKKCVVAPPRYEYSVTMAVYTLHISFGDGKQHSIPHGKSSPAQSRWSFMQLFGRNAD